MNSVRQVVAVAVLGALGGFAPADSAVSFAGQSSQDQPRPSLMKRQTPGGPLDGDVGAIKDRDGMVIIWNRSKPYFRMKVLGRDVSGFGETGAYFTVDGVFLQVLSVEATAFLPAGAKADAAAILTAHRDWDFKNIQRALGEKSVLTSHAGKLADGTPFLYWQVVPEKKLAAGSPSTYLMVTRFHAGGVIGATSVEQEGIPLDRAKALVFDAISHIQFSETMMNMHQIQKELAAGPR